MTNLILPENHHFLTSANDVADLCKPLFEQYSCNMFVYGKYYSNGEFILLSNQGDWINHHLSHGYSTPAPTPLKLLAQRESYHFISNEGPFHQAKHDLLTLFSTDQAVDFLTRENDYCEAVCFSFPSGCNDGYSTIFNNLSHFKYFSKEIKKKASKIFKTAEQNKVLLPQSMRGINFGVPQKNVGFKYENLSIRETEVLTHIVKGNTAKEIGQKLNLSPRTIEQHMKNIKIKMDVQSKSQLINKVMHCVL